MKRDASAEALLSTQGLIRRLGADVGRCRKGIDRAVGNAKPVEGGYEVDDFHSRQFIRAVFAYLEGASFAIKLWAVHKLSGENRISQEEVWTANETAFEVRNGNVIEKTAKIRLDENITYAFALLDRLHGIGPTLDKSLEWWASLQSSIKVRDRLTHPRRIEDLDVPAREFFDVMEAEQGFTDRMLAYPDLKK
jgi:hypothetical protein